MPCSGCGKGARAKTTRDRMVADHEAMQRLRQIPGGSWRFDREAASLVFVPNAPADRRLERYMDPADAIRYAVMEG